MVVSTSILERVIAPSDGSLPRPVADFLLSLQFPPEIHQRYEVLAGKAQDGSLTPDEHRELDEYLAADSMISLLKSKARHSLLSATR